MPNILRRHSVIIPMAAGLLAASWIHAQSRQTATWETVDQWMTELSNWGRWGKDDQRGTINLITAAKRKEAASLVKNGIAVSLSFNPPTERAVDNPSPLELTMGGNPGGGVALDTWKGSHHGFTFTPLDALCHWLFQGKRFNGFEAGDGSPPGGA